jgi:hypothetical protein
MNYILSKVMDFTFHKRREIYWSGKNLQASQTELSPCHWWCIWRNESYDFHTEVSYHHIS